MKSGTETKSKMESDEMWKRDAEVMAGYFLDCTRSTYSRISKPEKDGFIRIKLLNIEVLSKFDIQK